MDNFQKVVTYGIPSYNHINYVKQAIDSILNQTYKNIELIVIDDCSSDGSDKFLEQYSKEKGFTYIQNEKNIGPSRTSSKILNMARGQYVCLLASDDYIDSRKVELQMNFIDDSHETIDVLYGPVIEVDSENNVKRVIGRDKNEVIKAEEALQNLYETGTGLGLLQSGIMKTEVARKIDFLEGYKSDDFLFLVRLLQSGHTVGYLATPLTYYRLHKHNSHKNPDYCLFELEIPVVKDFFPKKYQKRHYANFWLTASIKWFNNKKYIKSIMYFLRSLFYDFKIGKIYDYGCILIGSRWVNLKRKIGIENITFIKRR
nr:glycosyltransferase [uncultured Eisenbergiella sp.]